jgi:tetratricopeptide (TPR) repeat protein
MSGRGQKGKKKSLPTSAHPWLLLAGLLALGIIAYWNSFDAPLVFDDLLTVQTNSAVRFGDFNWNPLSGRALLFITFTLNFLWTGQDVWSYHLVNLVFHLVNGVLLFFVTDHILRRAVPNFGYSRSGAFVGAAFFLLHPVQTESVTYISSRSELLSLVFYLAAFLLFIKWPESRIGFLFSLLVAVPFVLALSSKETAISLPAVIFLYDFLFLSGARLRPMVSRWRFYLPFLLGAIVVAYYIGTVTLRASIGSSLAGHLSSFQYFLTQLRVMVRYVYLTFVPVGLNLDYDFRPSTSPFEIKVVASFAFLAAIVVLGWLLRRTQPVFSFAIFWFFLTLAPTSSFVPIIDVIFEHRMYLPMAGVCLAIPILLQVVARKLNDWFGVPSRPGAYAAVLLAALMLGTILRNQTWRDEVRLYEDVVAKSPYKARGHTGLAWALYKRGEYEAAIQSIKQALVLLPDKRSEFADTLGNLYLKTGRYDDAANLFKETTSLISDPSKLALAYNNLGVTYLHKWQALKAKVTQMPDAQFREEAEKILVPAQEVFLKAVENDPAMSWAFDSYINATFDMGKADPLETAAMTDLQKNETFKSLYTVAKVSFLKQNWARADEFFTRAEKLNSNDKLLLFNHAYTLEKLGRPEDSIHKYLAAIRVDPIFIEAHHNVAIVYMGLRENQKAIVHLQEVLRYNPAHRSANLTLARIFASIGDRAAARRNLQTLLQASPQDPEILDLWRNLGL